MNSRLARGLLFLTLVFVLSPLFQKYDLIAGVDVAFVVLAFAIVICLQILAIVFLEYIETKHKGLQVLTCLSAGLFLSLNIFNFFFVLTNLRPYVFFIIFIPLAIILICSKYLLAVNNFIILLSVVLLFVMGGSIVVSKSKDLPKTEFFDSKFDVGKAKRSIYFISFDALVSREALAELYQTNERPHVNFLTDNGFSLYDILSPGIDTTSSFVQWFSFGALRRLRNPKDYFNGITPNPFYIYLKNRGFKQQFITPSNYFGTDMGLIDSFYPKSQSISICEFVNIRYAFGLCHGVIYKNLLEPILLRNNNQLSLGDQKLPGYEVVANNLAFASGPDASKWFSVSYVSFPGHAPAYFHDDLKSIERYRINYIDKLPDLKMQIQAIFQFIREKDPDAVIVIVGDHGGYLTGRWKLFDKSAPEAGSERMFDLDRRGVLLGVYPGPFCKDDINKMSDMSMLMKKLIDCAL